MTVYSRLLPEEDGRHSPPPGEYSDTGRLTTGPAGQGKYFSIDDEGDDTGADQHHGFSGHFNPFDGQIKEQVYDTQYVHVDMQFRGI